MSWRAINPDDLFDPSANNANHAVVDGDTIYISGQVGLDANAELVGHDIESQARRSFENLKNVLDAVDKELTDVVKVTSYLTDIQRDYGAYKEIWSEVFAEEPYPAHTALGVDELVVEGLVVEIEAQVPL